MAQRETFIIGEKEYGVSKIAAFEANGLILKLQKLVLPVLGGVAGSKSIMDIDVNSAFQIVSDNLDESVMTDIILPMFKLGQVASVSDGIKIDSSVAINKVFQDADSLADFYELVFEVMKFQFGVFFSNLMGRFGNKDGSPKVTG